MASLPHVSLSKKTLAKSIKKHQKRPWALGRKSTARGVEILRARVFCEIRSTMPSWLLESFFFLEIDRQGAALRAFSFLLKVTCLRGASATLDPNSSIIYYNIIYINIHKS